MKTNQVGNYQILPNLWCKLLRGEMKATGLLLLAAILIAIALPSKSFGVVVISDGFGDGDVNNNNIAFENDDVVGDYVPFFDDVSMTQDDSPLIFPANTMVIGPTVADDTSDRGIRWLSSGGFGSSNMGAAASSPRIVNDAAGFLPETVGNSGFLNTIPAVNETQFIPALGSGLALGVESKGRGRSLSGFFETDQDYSNGKQGTIQLGPKVDDEVKVSFDFRVWMSAANFNGNATNHVPDFGQLRFGLFEDTDNELGQTNNIAGSGFTPAVWGLENGLFRGDFAGPDATGDAGWYVRLPLQDADSNADPLFEIRPDGADARINEETNDLGILERFLQGTDNQTVALPDQVTPDFVNLETTKRYKVEFSLKRFDEAGGSTDPNVDGDNIVATLTVTDIDDPINSTWSLSGFDAADDLTGPGFDSDAWDYFSVALAGASDSDDFDFLIDNFTIEVNGSNAPVADADVDNDGDVDGGDFLQIQRTDPPLIALWQSEFGSGALTAASAVPEPSTIGAFCLGGLIVLGAARRNRKY